jgi:hypothetical protein
MDRSCRLLLLDKLGAVLDGDPRWSRVYREKIAEADSARLNWRERLSFPEAQRR